MSPETSHSGAGDFSTLEHRRNEMEPPLALGEQTLGRFEPDLDAELCFANGLVVLTEQRLLSREPDLHLTPVGRLKVDSPRRWRSWPLVEVAELRLVERVGYALLELRGHAALLTTWYFTARQLPSAATFVKRFHAVRIERSSSHLQTLTAPCPSCGSPLDPGEVLCRNCSAAPAPPPVRSLTRLVRFARPRVAWLVLALVLTLASTAASLIPPYITMPLLDKVLVPYQAGEHVNVGLVPWYLSGLFGAAIVAWVLGWGKTFVVARFGEQISADIRNETYDHLQRLSLDFFGSKRTGDLIARISNDTDRICDFISINLADFTTDVVMVIMTTVALLSINPAMAVVTLLPFPFIAWMIQSVRTRLRRGFARGSAAWSEMVNVLADTIPGVRVVKAFAQEKREMARFHQRNQHVLQANNRVNRLWSFFGPTVTLLTDGGLLVIWAYGVWSALHGHITVGVLTAFIAFIGRLYMRLDSMSRMLASTQRAAAATHRVFEILDRVPTVADPVHPVHPGRLSGMIELRDVSFKYGSRQVLSELNLFIEPGEMIGLVGPSGAGKSTIVNLICRFYDVASGAILVDGTDVRSFPIEEYRHNIGIVLQDPYLFYGSIAENIAYARPEASREQIIAAARAGRAHEFITKLPDGYDSLVGERGQSLSGGERQRISIARALLTDPRILILDEATSSVDTETEREIQQAIENLIRGRTTLAIAHRMGTLHRANRLVVVENGQIADVGSHDELLDRSPVYARLQDQQRITVPLGVGA